LAILTDNSKESITSQDALKLPMHGHYYTCLRGQVCESERQNWHVAIGENQGGKAGGKQTTKADTNPAWELRRTRKTR